MTKHWQQQYRRRRVTRPNREPSPADTVGGRGATASRPGGPLLRGDLRHTRRREPRPRRRQCRSRHGAGGHRRYRCSSRGWRRRRRSSKRDPRRRQQNAGQVALRGCERWWWRRRRRQREWRSFPKAELVHRGNHGERGDPVQATGGRRRSEKLEPVRRQNLKLGNCRCWIPPQETKM